MKKPIPPYFEYAPHSVKAEDKQIRDWRDDHDKNHPEFTRYMRNNLIGIITFSFVAAIALVILFAELIDALPVWLWTVLTLATVAGIVIIRSARKQFKK